MNVETEIAKINIKEWKELRITKDGNSAKSCLEHKWACGRFLKFLEEKILMKSTMRNVCSRCDNSFDETDSKIKDFQQAIKLYEEVFVLNSDGVRT